MKILIVEDDRALNEGIALSLKEHEILQAYCLKDAESLWHETVDLILLDINLPDGSGLTFCRKIRQTSFVPILFLTANDMETDIVTGLESGADDYITKPFSLAVLRARVNAAIRSRQGNTPVFTDGIFSFHFDSMRFFVNDTSVELSKTEQKLLKLLTANSGHILTRQMLSDRIWDDADFVDENALSVTVKRLREKLPGAPIKTVYGIGYTWETQK